MVPRQSARCENPGCARFDETIIIPSDSEPDFDGIEKAATVGGPEPSRTTTKRKAPNQPFPLPLPKRRETIPSVRDDSALEAAPEMPPHDPRFWYPDGNVVLKVGVIHFKLFRSRLAQHCRFFRTLFSPPTQDCPHPSSSADAAAPAKQLDGCALYEISVIDVNDFATFLTYLDYPLEHTVSNAPSYDIHALLRASDTLGCDLVLGLTKTAVAKQWPSSEPSKNDVCSYWRTGSRQRVDDAIQAIIYARKHRIPGVLKGAFHELLRNSAFWDALGHTRIGLCPDRTPPSNSEPEADHDVLSLLPLEDVLRLLQVDRELRTRWAELVRTPPGSDKRSKGAACEMCPGLPAENGQRQDRAEAWALETLHAGACVEFGDPIAGTYRMEDWLEKLKSESRGKWCAGCLDERKRVWGQARTGWWQKLDGWLRIGAGQRVPGKQMVVPRRERRGDSGSARLPRIRFVI